MRKLVSVISLITLCGQWALSQQKGSVNGQPFVQLIYHQGVHWNRTMYLDQQLEGGYKAIEAKVGFQTLGGEMWQQYSRYPKYGLGIHYADEVKDRSDTTMGNPFSAFMFYNIPMARFGRFTLNTNLSVGLSYMGVVYDSLTNPYNDIVGSHINLYFDVNLNMGVKLSERFDLNLGYGMTHYSNGRIHLPQKGLNNWGWQAGLTYIFGGPDDPFRRADFIQTEPPEFNPYEEVQLMISAGVTEWQPDDVPVGVHYLASSFTADYAYRFNVRSAVTLGADVMYDGSLEKAIKHVLPEDVNTIQKMYFGGHIGYQFTIDKLTFLFNAGTYFLHYSYDRRFFFARAGGRIRLTDHLGIHICVKSRNGIRSDWIEWGMAYSIRTRTLVPSQN
ncbi:MAG: acyloxyacyl hydrolase [Bacteroidales bacterium]